MVRVAAALSLILTAAHCPADPDLRDGMPEAIVAGRDLSLTKHHELSVTRGPCDGRLFMSIARPIAGVTHSAPETAKGGETVNLRISVNDPAEKPLPAVIPH